MFSALELVSSRVFPWISGLGAEKKGSPVFSISWFKVYGFAAAAAAAAAAYANSTGRGRFFFYFASTLHQKSDFNAFFSFVFSSFAATAIKFRPGEGGEGWLYE